MSAELTGSTVHRWFLRSSHTGAFERLAHALIMADRERVGREASPAAAVLDAQAARSGGTGVAGRRGYDPARRVVGRKRHAFDTDGRLLLAAISTADLHDSHGGVALLRASRRSRPLLARCFADRAHAGERAATATSTAVTIVGAPNAQKGFAVHPRRPPGERRSHSAYLALIETGGGRAAHRPWRHQGRLADAQMGRPHREGWGWMAPTGNPGRR